MGPANQATSILRSVDCCNSYDPNLVVGRIGDSEMARYRRQHLRSVDRRDTGVSFESVLGLASN